MASVVIEGWRVGARVVSAIQLLEPRGGIGLAEAKRLVDAVLAGDTVDLIVGDADAGASLAAELQHLGFKARLDRPPVPYRRPPRDPDFAAKVAFVAAEEGGRPSPVCSGYRPSHDLGLPGEVNDGLHEYPGEGWVHPGEAAAALVWLVAPERQLGRLRETQEFTVLEGARVVAHGAIVEVLNPDLRGAS